MMESGATKKLNHGSTYLPDLWPHPGHGHHHTDCVSLHLQNLRKNEVCFYIMQYLFDTLI